MYLVNDTEKTKSVAKAVAEHHKTWAEASVPKALQTSHAEIKSWIGQVQGNLEKAPALLQGGSLELVKYLSQFGNYEDLRKNPATALSGMDVTLTPIEKKAPEKKWSNCPSADNERPSLTAISVWATLGVESLEVSP